MELEKETTYEHYTKYADMMEELGLGILNKDTFLGLSLEEVTNKFLEDKNLNNISRKWWDGMWANYRLYHPKKASGKSMAEGVCVYKHLCIYHFLEATPVFTK